MIRFGWMIVGLLSWIINQYYYVLLLYSDYCYIMIIMTLYDIYCIYIYIYIYIIANYYDNLWFMMDMYGFFWVLIQHLATKDGPSWAKLGHTFRFWGLQGDRCGSSPVQTPAGTFIAAWKGRQRGRWEIWGWVKTLSLGWEKWMWITP